MSELDTTNRLFEKRCQLIPRNHVLGLALTCLFLVAAIIEVVV